MENIIYPFPCPIYQSFLDESSFLEIKKDTYDFIDNNINLFKQEWTCPTLSTINVPKDQNINSKILKEKIKFYVEEYCKFWNWSTPLLVALNNCWVNISKNGAYQETHNHGSSLISGVIYVNVNENSGGFQLINPLTTESILMGSPDKVFGPTYNITPQQGMILLFPGWMDHRVLPNESNIDRISISFNINRNF